MISKTTRRFREAFGRLPQHVQRGAREAYRRFQADPSHPSLRFKRVRTTRPIYSARIGLDYRALAVVDGDDVIWFWIGSHADCDQILRTL